MVGVVVCVCVGGGGVCFFSGSGYEALYHGLAIYREVTFVNVTSVAENTE